MAHPRLLVGSGANCQGVFAGDGPLEAQLLSIRARCCQVHCFATAPRCFWVPTGVRRAPEQSPPRSKACTAADGTAGTAAAQGAPGSSAPDAQCLARAPWHCLAARGHFPEALGAAGAAGGADSTQEGAAADRKMSETRQLAGLAPVGCLVLVGRSWWRCRLAGYWPRWKTP